MLITRFTITKIVEQKDLIDQDPDCADDPVSDVSPDSDLDRSDSEFERLLGFQSDDVSVDGSLETFCGKPLDRERDTKVNVTVRVECTTVQVDLVLDHPLTKQGVVVGAVVVWILLHSLANVWFRFDRDLILY